MKLNIYCLFVIFNFYAYAVNCQSISIIPNSGQLNGLKFSVLASITGTSSYTCHIDSGSTQPGTSCQANANGTWSVNPAEITGSTYVVLTLTRNIFPSTSLTEYLTLSCCQSSTVSASSQYTAVFDTYTLNTTNAITNNNERTIDNPAFVNMASCPCDLTVNQCDYGCCCDSACPTPTNFTCISGYYGGQSVGVSSRYCTGPASWDTPDYHVITCIVFENNAVLGYYYSVQGALKTVSAFTAKRNALTVKGFENSPLTNIVPTLGTGYKQSSALLATFGPLLLPTVSASGVCSRSTPVRFLTDTKGDCFVTMDTSICAQYSVASYDAYLTTNTNGVLYLNGTTQTTANPNVTCTPSPCASAVISGSNCNNAVTGITYSFGVSGSKIQSFSVSVTTGTVPLNSRFKQTFQTSFLFPSISSAVNPNKLSQSSGLLGYEKFKPLISGKQTTYTNGSFVITVDAADSVAVLKPSSSQKCSDATRSLINFPSSMMAVCQYEVTEVQLKNCSVLNDTMLSILNGIIPSNVIAMYGSPSLTDSTDWISIFRNPIVPLSSSNYSSYSLLSEVPICNSMPSGISLYIFYADQGRARSQPIYQIIGAFITYSLSDWTLTCNPNNPSSPCIQSDPAKRVSTVSLSSTVMFMEVPATWNTSSSFSTPEICYGGICWSQAFSPWTSTDIYTQDELRYNLAMGCFLVFIAVVGVIVTQPWW